MTRRVARVGQERADLLGRRRQPGQVEVDPAEELGVGAELRREDLHPLPLGGDQLVDLVLRGGCAQTKPVRSPITVSVVAA